MPHEAPFEPWLSFLNNLDAAANEHAELYCMGGFAIVQAYGLGRATADIDVLSVAPYSSGGRLLELAGKESLLRKKHGIYLDVLTVAAAPEDYLARVTPLYPSSFSASGQPPRGFGHDGEGATVSDTRVESGTRCRTGKCQEQPSFISQAGRMSTSKAASAKHTSAACLYQCGYNEQRWTNLHH